MRELDTPVDLNTEPRLSGTQPETSVIQKISISSNLVLFKFV